MTKPNTNDINIPKNTWLMALVSFANNIYMHTNTKNTGDINNNRMVSLTVRFIIPQANERQKKNDEEKIHILLIQIHIISNIFVLRILCII